MDYCYKIFSRLNLSIKFWKPSLELTMCHYFLIRFCYTMDPVRYSGWMSDSTRQVPRTTLRRMAEGNLEEPERAEAPREEEQMQVIIVPILFQSVLKNLVFNNVTI